MDIITLAMTQPKVIDLTKYADEYMGNLNNLVLERYSIGGGWAVREWSESLESFWAALDTPGPVSILIDATATSGYTLAANRNTTAINASGVGAVHTFIVHILEGPAAVGNLTIGFSREFLNSGVFNTFISVFVGEGINTGL